MKRIIFFIGLITAILTSLSALELNPEYKITYLQIGSDSCVPCKMMRPVMADIIEEYKGIVDVQYIDVRKDKNTPKMFNVRVIPTQIFLNKKGEVIFRNEGYIPTKDIKIPIDNHLKEQGE